MTYKGIYRPVNTRKYRGDARNIIYRSLWERQTFRWLDTNPDVKSWSSEEVVIPYVCRTDGRVHRYFVDLYIEFKDGKIFIVEIKPESQTLPPKPPKRKTPRYVAEVMGYAKNLSKWETAEQYAKDRNWTFEVWTEKTLEGLGIKLLLKG